MQITVKRYCPRCKKNVGDVTVTGGSVVRDGKDLKTGRARVQFVCPDCLTAEERAGKAFPPEEQGVVEVPDEEARCSVCQGPLVWDMMRDDWYCQKCVKHYADHGDHPDRGVQ